MARSVELLTSAQAMISRTVSSSPTASGSALSAKSLLRIVCPPLSAPPLLALSLKNKQTLKKKKKKKPTRSLFPTWAACLTVTGRRTLLHESPCDPGWRRFRHLECHGLPPKGKNDQRFSRLAFLAQKRHWPLPLTLRGPN